ncbi:MAG: hypothetical protein LBN39_11505, partial [Planctomycetaceae bacterium]|nr:hypothetical protein [Planctomycetaceae bacterium]
ADSFAVHYDSADPKLNGIQQTFRSAKPDRTEKHGEWTTAHFTLPLPRFENRSNGSDFRLYVSGGEIIVKEVSLRK